MDNVPWSNIKIDKFLLTMSGASDVTKYSLTIMMTGVSWGGGRHLIILPGGGGGEAGGRLLLA